MKGVDERKLDEALEKYVFRRLEKGLREVQMGLNMLAYYFLKKKKYGKAYVATQLYMDFIRIARVVRTVLEEEGLITEEDIERLEDEEEKDEVNRLMEESIEKG